MDEDITLKTMTDNQTWNTCPKCLKSWEDKPSIPGLLHRTRYCDKCKELMKNEVFGHMHEGKSH